MIDPRPDLYDTNLWRRIFVTLAKEEPRTDELADLFWMLWTIRSAGTMIKPTPRLKFVPLISPAGFWDSEKEFQEIVGPEIKKHIVRINKLLAQLQEGDRYGKKEVQV